MSSLSHAPQRARRWRDWSLRIAVMVVCPVLLLVATEVALRIFHVGTPTGPTRPCTIHGQPGACSNEFFTRTFFPPRMARSPRPYAIPTEKAPGTIRIFVLGESAAYGDPEPTYGFSRYLEMMLRQRYPDKKFEVINSGITAINSHVIVRIAEDLAEHQPDLFLVYAGNNEVVGPYGAGTVITTGSPSMAMIRASTFVRSMRLGQLLESAAIKVSAHPGQQQEWRGMEMFLNNQVLADSPAMSRVYEHFDANLRQIIRVGRNAGARVLISTVATNESDCAPFASAHREGLDAAALRSWSEHLEQGAAAEAAGDQHEAIKHYQAAAEIDGSYAELHFRLARCMRKLGDSHGAKFHFTQARDLDTLRFRADSRINQAIRAVASTAGPDVKLLDFETMLSDQSPDHAPGHDFFYEHVHLNPHGNYALARAMFMEIQKMPELGETAEPPSQEECEHLLAFTGFDRDRVYRDVLGRLHRPPFINQLNHDEQINALQQDIERIVAETPEQTAAQYRWSLARHPDDLVLHMNYGLFLYRYDRAAAKEEFRIAKPFDDAPYLANWTRKLN